MVITDRAGNVAERLRPAVGGAGMRGRTTAVHRIGDAGYQWDPAIQAFHVRHRVYRPDTGSWTRRDPLGYVDGMSVYEYVKSAPLHLSDPQGLQAGKPKAAPAQPATPAPCEGDAVDFDPKVKDPCEEAARLSRLNQKWCAEKSGGHVITEVNTECQMMMVIDRCEIGNITHDSPMSYCKRCCTKKPGAEECDKYLSWRGAQDCCERTQRQQVLANRVCATRRAKDYCGGPRKGIIRYIRDLIKLS